MKTNFTPDSNSLDPYFRYAFSINIILITFHDRKLKVLIQEKDEIPFQNKWGLPGKLILPNEDADKELDTMLKQLVGQSSFYTKQLATFSDLQRHPLGRVVNFAYYGLVPYEQLEKNYSSTLNWCDYDQIPELIIDHNQIIKKVLSRFRKGLLRHPIVFNVLPQKFIISDIITVYEQVFSQKMDVRNFRRKLLASELLTPLGETQKSKIANGRPAQLYSLNNISDELQDKILFDLSIYLTRVLKHK